MLPSEKSIKTEGCIVSTGSGTGLVRGYIAGGIIEREACPEYW